MKETVVKCGACHKFFGWTETDPKCRFCHAVYGKVEEKPAEKLEEKSGAIPNYLSAQTAKKGPAKTRKESFKMQW